MTNFCDKSCHLFLWQTNRTRLMWRICKQVTNHRNWNRVCNAVATTPTNVSWTIMKPILVTCKLTQKWFPVNPPTESLEAGIHKQRCVSFSEFYSRCLDKQQHYLLYYLWKFDMVIAFFFIYVVVAYIFLLMLFSWCCLSFQKRLAVLLNFLKNWLSIKINSTPNRQMLVCLKFFCISEHGEVK